MDSELKLFAAPLQPSPAKLETLLDRLCQHRPWFNDHLWHDPAVRRTAATLRLSEVYARGLIWEVYRGPVVTGLLMLDSIVEHSSAQCHFVFFDSKLSDKHALCLDTMRWSFETLSLHTLRVEIPTHVRPLLKFVRRLGFRYEAEGRSPSWPKLGVEDWRYAKPLTEKQAALGSRRHQTFLYNGRWEDALLLSVTREEFDRGWSERIPESSQHSPTDGPHEPAGRPAEGVSVVGPAAAGDGPA